MYHIYIYIHITCQMQHQVEIHINFFFLLINLKQFLFRQDREKGCFYSNLNSAIFSPIILYSTDIPYNLKTSFHISNLTCHL
jgi:hypothetical protein